MLLHSVNIARNAARLKSCLFLRSTIYQLKMQIRRRNKRSLHLVYLPINLGRHHRIMIWLTSAILSVFFLILSSHSKVVPWQRLPELIV
jgi:hypothetical protein